MRHRNLSFIFLFFAASLFGCEFTSTTKITNQAGIEINDTAAVQIAWIASTGSPQGYVIEESVDNQTFTVVQTVGANITSVDVSHLSTGRTYYYRVRAFNVQGYSAYTPSTSIQIPL